MNHPSDNCHAILGFVERQRLARVPEADILRELVQALTAAEDAESRWHDEEERRNALTRAYGYVAPPF